jgi:hypothetical protein
MARRRAAGRRQHSPAAGGRVLLLVSLLPLRCDSAVLRQLNPRAASKRPVMSSSVSGWSTTEEYNWVIDDVSEEEDPAKMLARAWEEEAVLGLAPGLALSSPGDVTTHLRARGVARLAGVLSPGTIASLRDDILRQLARVRETDAELVRSDGQRQSLLSAVLSSSAEPGAQKHTRWDLRLRLTPPVRRAVREALSCAALAGTLAAAAGPDAELWECAALISAPGAAPQPLHADTLWDEDGVLFSTFIALQSVTLAMGPTRFLIGSHTLEAHDAFDDAGILFVSDISDSAAAGLLSSGRVPAVSVAAHTLSTSTVSVLSRRPPLCR